MTRLPTGSTVHVKPGGMTLVESNWVMIAGPSMTLPASSSVRS